MFSNLISKPIPFKNSCIAYFEFAGRAVKMYTLLLRGGGVGGVGGGGGGGGGGGIGGGGRGGR